MEASFNFRTKAPTELVGLEAMIPPNPLTPEEGVLYADYELPEYDSEVNAESVTFGKPSKQDNFGRTYPIRLTMHDKDETVYKLLYCEAANPKSDLWVVKDTAWSTQPDRGLNVDVARKLMSMGFNVLIKGPELGSSIPQSNSAFNTHKVLGYMAAHAGLDARHFAVEGYSRGSMLGFGTNAYAHWFDRKVIYSNLTDPCLGLPIKLLDKPTAKKAIGLPADLASLGIDVIRGMMSPGRGLNLMQTVDISKKGLKQFIETGKPLMTGEAGMMAARTPMNMNATVAFFRGCGVNDAATFKEVLAGRPGVRFVSPEGGHGKGIDSKIIGNIAVRFQRLAEQCEEGRRPDELDYRHITYGIRVV